MSWALEVKGIDIPWEEVAAIVHPGATGEAFKQAMSKLRAKRLKEGLPVPPVRPGKEKSRKDCEAELKRILDGAREVREAKNAGKPADSGPKNASDDYDGGDEETPPTVSHNIPNSFNMPNGAFVFSLVYVVACPLARLPPGDSMVYRLSRTRLPDQTC